MKNTTSPKLSLEKIQITKFHGLGKIMGGSKSGYIDRTTTTDSKDKTKTTKEEDTVQTPDTTEFRYH